MQAKQIAGAKAWREERAWGLWRMGEVTVERVTLDEIERVGKCESYRPCRPKERVGVVFCNHEEACVLG